MTTAIVTFLTSRNLGVVVAGKRVGTAGARGEFTTADVPFRRRVIVAGEFIRASTA